MAPPRIQVIAPVGWLSAFLTWIALGGLSFERFTVVFWIVTGLVAFTIGRRPWWQAPLDWSPFVFFFLAYDFTRGAASTLGFRTHWELPARIDRVLGLGDVPSAWLQEHTVARYDQVPWWEMLTSAVYMSFFVVPFLLAAVLWVRSRPTFVRFMTQLMAVSAIALVGYVLVPSAPPWAAARCTHAEVASGPSDPACMYDNDPSDRQATVIRGIHPTNDFSPVVRRITTRGWLEIPGMHLTDGFVKTGIDASNPVAAVPSLHAAEALLVAVFLWPLTRRRWRPLLLLYPLAMGFTLVWGGDHFVLDILLGWGVVGVVMAALSRMPHRTSHRKALVPAVVSA